MKVHRCLLLLVLVLALAALASAEGSGAASSEKPPSSAAVEPKVTVSASDMKVTEVLASMAKQSKQKMIVESTVKGKVTLSLKDTPLEAALGAVCKAGKMEWRKVYISPDSKLLEQPDRFASTVRLMSGLGFPDVILAASSVNKVGVHCQDTKAVRAAVDTLSKDMGMTAIYLVTNDTAAAAKSMSKDDADKDANVQKYIDMTKQQMDMFLKMTPEEREQTMLSAINMMDQVDPSYMSTVWQTLMRADPQALRQMMAKQTQLLFHIPESDRRAMMKFNMQAAGMITPEQQRILQEDAKAVMEEMKREAGQLPTSQ